MTEQVCQTERLNFFFSRSIVTLFALIILVAYIIKLTNDWPWVNDERNSR